MARRRDRLVILSRNVFDATGAEAFDGFIATEGNRIARVGRRSEAGAYMRKATRVVDAGNRTVIPGMTDNHTFFTGWALLHLGCNLSDAHDAEAGIEKLRAYASAMPQGSPVFGHDWNATDFGPDAEGLLDAAFPDVPVVAFTHERDSCWMNAAARERYRFSPEECYAEKIWRMMADYLPLPQMRGLYREYMHMLNARGVTQVKEMAFDDYYGFSDVMEAMEAADELSVRVRMMSQPVGRGICTAEGRVAVSEHLVHRHRGGNAAVADLVNRHPQDGQIHPGHALQPPVDRVTGDKGVDFLHPLLHSGHQRLHVFGFVFIRADFQHAQAGVLTAVSAHFPLVQ